MAAEKETMPGEVAHIPVIEKAELTVAEEMNQRLRNAGLDEQVIARMYERAETVDKEITDAKEYAAALAVLKEFRPIVSAGNTTIDNAHAGVVELWKFSIEMVKEKKAWIQGPQLVILQHTRKWEAERDRLAKEEEQRIEAMKEERKTLVAGLGYTFVSGPPAHMYVLEEVSITVSEINELDHESWNMRFSQLRLKSEEVAARLLEEQELRDAEADRLRQVAADTEARQKEQDEREQRLVTMTLNARVSELKAMGLQEHAGGYLSVIKVHPGDIPRRLYDINTEVLGVSSEEIYTRWKGEAQEHIDAIKAEEERAANIERINEARLQELSALGCEAKEVGGTPFIGIEHHPSVKFWLPADELYPLENWPDIVATATKRVASVKKELVRETRAQQLRDAGVTWDEHGGTWRTEKHSCYWESVGDWNDEQFAEQLEEFKADIANAADQKLLEQQEAEKRDAVIRDRVAQLKNAGWVEAPHPQTQEPQICLSEGGGPFTQVFLVDTLYQLQDQTIDMMVSSGVSELFHRQQAHEAEVRENERQRLEKEQKDEQRREHERKERMSDIELWEEFKADVNKIAPKMTSATGQHGVKRLLEHMEKMTPGLINDLSQ